MHMTIQEWFVFRILTGHSDSSDNDFDGTAYYHHLTVHVILHLDN